MQAPRVRRFRAAAQPPGLLTGVLDVAGVADGPARRRARRTRQAGQDRSGRREGRVRRPRARARGRRDRARDPGFRGGRRLPWPTTTPSRSSGSAAFVDGTRRGVAGIATMREVLALADRTPAARRICGWTPVWRGGCRTTREHHGDDRAGPGGQPRRRWPLRQPGRDVPRPARARVPASRWASSAFSSSWASGACSLRARPPPPADVLVAQWSAAAAADALTLARELRSGGLRVEVYPDADKLGKQFKYAASTGVPLVVIEGDDERAVGEVTVKDLGTGEQQRHHPRRGRRPADGRSSDPAVCPSSPTLLRPVARPLSPFSPFPFPL